jgi:hypothetical protein
MNFIIEAEQNVYASRTRKNGGSRSKSSFLINPVAGKEWIRVSIRNTCVQKLNSGNPGQRGDGC